MANENTISKTPAQESTQAEHTRAGFYYRPNVDIIEHPDELVLLADVPGARPDGIEVNFEDGTLTLHAKVAPRHEEVEFLVREYGVGDFWRTFRVAETVDAGKISAEYADGVLALHLPKAEAARPRKIAIQA